MLAYTLWEPKPPSAMMTHDGFLIRPDAPG
jgi:hypothetical protein